MVMCRARPRSQGLSASAVGMGVPSCQIFKKETGSQVLMEAFLTLVLATNLEI